jgi:hypothetical protein
MGINYSGPGNPGPATPLGEDTVNPVYERAVKDKGPNTTKRDTRRAPTSLLNTSPPPPPVLTRIVDNPPGLDNRVNPK